MTELQIQAAKWLKRAESSYAKANIGRKDINIMLEDLCFDAQQAAEKALKAILVVKNLEVPRTHSIGYLLNLIKESGVEISNKFSEMAILTEYAVQTRYPGDYEAVSEDEYQQSLKLAFRAIEFAKSIIYTPNLFNL